MSVSTVSIPLDPKSVRNRFRSEMPIVDKWAYFDHAAVGPLPRPAGVEIRKWLSGAVHEGDTIWPSWLSAHESLRDSGADLLGCQRTEIAIIPNTSTGISIIAEGLRWQPGDNVIIFENEFPSNSLPWQNLARRGVELRSLPVPECGTIDLKLLADAIDSKTRLVSISWVGYASGYRVNLEDVCEIVGPTDAKLMVDAIQGLGVFPLNVASLPIDFLAADGHKWMLGPEGAGLLYIDQQSFELLDSVIVGWGSSRDAANFMPGALDLKPNATRYEVGSINMVGSHGFGASLKLLLSLGAANPDGPLAETVLQNADQLAAALEKSGAVVHRPSNRANQTGIVPFTVESDDYSKIRQEMLDAGIALSVRAGKIRASVHGYNNAEDIERLANFVARLT